MVILSIGEICVDPIFNSIGFVGIAVSDGFMVGAGVGVFVALANSVAVLCKFLADNVWNAAASTLRWVDVKTTFLYRSLSLVPVFNKTK